MRFTWTGTLDDQPYTVELEYGYWSGRRVVYLNGERVHKSRKFVNVGTGEYPFQIGAHPCRVSLKTDKKRGFMFTLYIEEEPQETHILSMGQLYSMLFPLHVLSIIPPFIVDGAVALVWIYFTRTPFNTRSLSMIPLFAVSAAAIWFAAKRIKRSQWLRIGVCLAIVLVNIVIALSVALNCACDYLRNNTVRYATSPHPRLPAPRKRRAQSG